MDKKTRLKACLLMLLFTCAPFISYYGFYGGVFMADLVAGLTPESIGKPEHNLWFQVSKVLFGTSVLYWIFSETLAFITPKPNT